MEVKKLRYHGVSYEFDSIKEFDRFILTEFIPDNVRMKINYSRRGKDLIGSRYDDEYEERKPYPSIRLNAIKQLNLSKELFDHVIKLLEREGIRIGGFSHELDVETANYDYIKTYASPKYEKLLTPQEEKDKFNEYRKTHDPELREELILRNVRLVPYVAWQIALRHEVNQHELESYGYEGLIKAIDKYDPNLDARFAVYAISWISGCIKLAVPKLKRIPDSIYYVFQRARYTIEKEFGKKYDGDPKMLKAILDLMYRQGKIKGMGRYYELESFFRDRKGPSIEQMREDDVDITVRSLDDHLDERIDYGIAKEDIKEVLESLPPREQKIIMLRFGLIDGHQRSLKEVAKEFNLTAARIGQIEARAIRRLRHPSNSDRLRKYKDYVDLTDQEIHELGMLYDSGEDEEVKRM